MTRSRFTPWIVLACIGTLAGCSAGEGGTAGNTELNVIIPNGSGNGSSAPSAFDIQVVEYTISCLTPDAIVFPADLNPSGPDPSQAVTINGVLEVLDTAGPGVNTQDFGPDLNETYVWQGFMDLPPGPCNVQLRARDGDGEVICTATEPFTITADSTVKVNVLMICDISFQAPVGMLDLDASFQFNVGNFCPSAYILNCIDTDIDIQSFGPPIGDVAATACQTRFEDIDSTCGAGCDPQVCTPTPTGLDCVPGPDPGVSTTISCVSDTPFGCAIPGPLFGTPCTPVAGDPCFDASGGAACVPGAVIDCTGTGTPEPFCLFTGDTLGNIGDGPPGPFAPGIGGFFVACVLADDDGDPLTPDVAVAAGQNVTCTAVTTDGDTDCDKTKTVTLTCPGLTQCQTFVTGGGSCDDGTVCTADSCDEATCDGATAAACCVNAPANDGGDCSAENGGLPAICGGGVCLPQNCTDDTFCDSGAECTGIFAGICDLGTGICAPEVPDNEGGACDAGGGAGTGSCTSGVCVDNCAGVSCDDGNECTDDGVCDSLTGLCSPSVNDDTNSCTTCPGVGGATCECISGSCVDAPICPPPTIVGQAQTVCRNSFNQANTQFPVDYVIDLDDCAFANSSFNADITPTLNFDQGFLQIAATTLCPFGIDICTTGADFTDVQVMVASTQSTPGIDTTIEPAVGVDQGASCTPQLSELPGTPVNQALTCSAACPAPVVTAPVSIPLPLVTLACTAGTGLGGPGPNAPNVSICGTGLTPISATGAPTGTIDANTWAEVDIGFPNPVSFQCGDATLSAGGAACTSDADCADGTAGETPFSGHSTCGAQTAGQCDTVPLATDPAVDCAIFPVQ